MVIPSGPAGQMISGQLRRPRYFPGQLVTAAELTADQTYFREIMRRHNRYLHGCGVVCGLEVLLTEDNSGQPQLLVTPGHAISPQGDDIHVPEQQVVSLGAVGECVGPGEGQRRYLILRYIETPVCPVPPLPDHCMPVVGQQHSRLEAAFELQCTSILPTDCGEMPSCGDLTCELLRDTPAEEEPCPGDGGPWVILAAVDLDANGGVVSIDYGVRRRVLSVQFLVEALRCLLPRVTGMRPGAGTQGTRLLTLIFGERLTDTRSVSFEGTGIATQIQSLSPWGGWVLIQMDIAANAPLGRRGFQVTTSRGVVNSAACGVEFTVLPRLAGYGYGYGYAPYGVRGDHMTAGVGGNLL
jgi:hypothetical protein